MSTPTPPPGWRNSMSSVGSFDDWEAEDEPEEEERQLEAEGAALAFVPQSARDGVGTGEAKRVRRTRMVLLGLACSMSIGSHYGSYLLGPVKHTLHLGEGSFATFISSFQLVNTITPLVSGLLVPRFGAAKVGLVATGCVFFGQLIVVWAQSGGEEQSVGWMIVGLAAFGIGLSPIAVVQEAIILRNNSSTSKSVARSIALGLLFGKSAAFAAAYSAEPLAAVSPQLPFRAAALLSLLSFAACIAYSIIERTLPPLDEDVDEKDQHGISTLNLSEATQYGDAFWLYIVVCFLGGAWYTTIHLSSHLLQSLYRESEANAGAAASVILLSSTILYPLIGWLVDKRPHALRALFVTVPSLVAATFGILLFLRPVVPYFLAFLPAAIGIGSGPLLLVIVVPRLVERHHSPIALGIHKSLEMAGATLSVRATSWLLSSPAPDSERATSVVQVLSALILLQLAVVIGWWRLIRHRERLDDDAAMEYGLLPTHEGVAEDDGEARLAALAPVAVKGSRSAVETRRGVHFLRGSVAVVVLSWVAFILSLRTQ